MGPSDPAPPAGPPLPDASPIAGATLAHDFDRAAGFFAAPFPSADLRDAAGRPDPRAFPNPESNPWVAALVDLATDGADGFALTAGVTFSATAPLGPLPTVDPAASLRADSPLALVDVDPTSPTYGARHPITWDHRADPGPYGAPNLLTLLPVQGVPLAPNTRYAALATRALTDAAGAPLGRPAPLADLLAGRPLPALPDAARAEYDAALTALVDLDYDVASLAGLAVFRTGDPAAELGAFLDHARTLPAPPPPTFAPAEVFDTFCVFTATTTLPSYQSGDPPYLGDPDAGGRWGRDDAGAPALVAHVEARVVITIPRRPMPASGYPTAVFVRTGGGGDRPLVDRGVRAAPGGEAIAPGTGPALELARVGFAGVSVDGPHGGPRNPTGGDEQFLTFNITNPAAMRDNVRQSALELALLPGRLGAWSVDASACPGAGADARLDADRLALIGHSMGAWFAPLVLAWEPRYGAAVLSGAGGSWIENVVHKESPVAVRPFAEAFLGYSDRALHAHDPVLSLVQWALEGADPAVYGARARGGGVALPPNGLPAHVLMIEGVVDTYILPPIANTTALSLALDLAGPELDRDHPELAAFAPLSDVLPLVGGAVVPLPAAGNRGDGAVTAVVVQHLEDGVEDGHEVFFQLEAPKRQLRAFLEAFAAGATPSVPSP